MNDLHDFAHELAKTAAAITGHEQKDWLVLAQTSGTTMRWAGRMAHGFSEILAQSPSTAALIGQERELRETNLTTWLEGVLSGAPSRAFWTECTMIGLAHAAAAVPAGLVVAGGRHLEELFLQSCMRVFEPVEAMRVHTAFARVLSTAVAVMTTASEDVMKECIGELGIDRTKLDGRVRFSVHHRLRDERARLPLMDWTPGMSVGIEAIDTQHRQLFALLNAFHKASTDESDEVLLREVVGDLIDYTKIHFAFEETLLKKHQYPEIEAHQDGHARLARQVHQFASAANFGAGLLAAELYFFLRTWLNGHIRGTDRRYTDHLHARGVS